MAEVDDVNDNDIINLIEIQCRHYVKPIHIKDNIYAIYLKDYVAYSDLINNISIISSDGTIAEYLSVGDGLLDSTKYINMLNLKTEDLD